jgi:hypothetical protein
MKLRVPVMTPDQHVNREVEYTVLGPEDLKPILEELDRLHQKVARLETHPPTAAITADAINIAGLKARAEEAEARAIAWMEDCHRARTNSDYYRGLVVKIGRMLGQEAKTTDDGIIAEDIQCAKVPGCVKEALDATQLEKGEANLYHKLCSILAHNRILVLRRYENGAVQVNGEDSRTFCQGKSLSDALDKIGLGAYPATAQTYLATRFYPNGVPRYVKCRGCGNEGLGEAEFISPHTGLCAPCEEKRVGGRL